MSGGSYEYKFEEISSLGEAILERSRGNKRREIFAAALEAASKTARVIEWVDSCDSAWPDDDMSIVAFFGEMKRLAESIEELEMQERKLYEGLKRRFEKGD